MKKFNRDSLDTTISFEKVELIVKELRKTLELFKKNEPEGIGYEEYLHRQVGSLNGLETVCGLAPSFWSKDENGQWILVPKSEV